MSSPAVRGVATILVAVATAIVILTGSIAPFFSSAWLGFVQDRADVTAWTGYSPAEVRLATDALVHDLVLGPPAFDVAIRGTPVLSERERSHLRDVRSVFGWLALLAGGSVLVLAATALRARGARWAWLAVRAGSLALAGATVVMGIVAAVAFDAAFEVFHRLFFAGGTYTFDPRTDRLVQLFPDQLWFETSLAVGSTILAASLLVAWLAGRRVAPPIQARVVTPAGSSRRAAVNDELRP